MVEAPTFATRTARGKGLRVPGRASARSLLYLLRVSMNQTAVGRVGLIIGGVMTALGAWIAIRALVLRAPPYTGGFGIDIAFAIFFIARGLIQFRRWQLARDRVSRA